MRKNRTKIIVAVVFVLLFIFYFYINSNNDVTNDTQKNTVTINDVVFDVSIADTETERSIGLSKKTILKQKEGMLFVFDDSGVYPFWMKDMNFPIDIIWIDKDLKIVYMKENIHPESYPKIFNLNTKAMYVLEVSAGVVKNNKIKIGDDVVLNISPTGR